jgi:hypothetical protein
MAELVEFSIFHWNAENLLPPYDCTVHVTSRDILTTTENQTDQHIQYSG